MILLFIIWLIFFTWIFLESWNYYNEKKILTNNKEIKNRIYIYGIIILISFYLNSTDFKLPIEQLIIAYTINILFFEYEYYRIKKKAWYYTKEFKEIYKILDKIENDYFKWAHYNEWNYLYYIDEIKSKIINYLYYKWHQDIFYEIIEVWWVKNFVNKIISDIFYSMFIEKKLIFDKWYDVKKLIWIYFIILNESIELKLISEKEKNNIKNIVMKNYKDFLN